MKKRLIFAVLPTIGLLCALNSARAQDKKEAADLIVSGATIVTMDEKRHVFEEGALAVKGDVIVAIGPSKEILAKYGAKQKIDAGGKLMMPGLINGHTHIPMVLMRGLSDDVTLDDWLR